MNKENKLIVFEDKRIRRTWFNDDWYYSIIDVIAVLVESSRARKYWSDLKIKLIVEGYELSDFIGQFKLSAEDDKLRQTDCTNIKGLFRIIQSIPSKKVEPFKQWLAQLGQERIEEIENPEIAQDRIKSYYEMKGYPKEWVDKRLRGITIRQELTDEWKNRGIEEKKDYAILTNEITKATFGLTIDEYKKYKNISILPKSNLRDNMTDWELILTMIGEKATTDITVVKDAKGFEECKITANQGGNIAKNTRLELESKIDKSLISSNNVRNLTENNKIRNKHKK